MTPAEIADTARSLLLSDATQPSSSAQLAVRAVDACERLSLSISRLMGETGSRAIFNRGLLLTRTRFPWIASLVGTAGLRPGESPWTPLRTSMELQDPDVAMAAFVALVTALHGILGNLIGASFASLLLREAWPEARRR